MPSADNSQAASDETTAPPRKRRPRRKKPASGKADVVALLNPSVRVTLRGAKRLATAEEITIRRLLAQAIKDKNARALKRVLEIFDKCDLLTSAYHELGHQIIVPKYFEVDDYMKSLKGVRSFEEWAQQMPPVNILGRLAREKDLAKRRQIVLKNLGRYDELMRERRTEAGLVFEARRAHGRLFRTLDYIDRIFDDYDNIFQGEGEYYDRWLDEDEENWKAHKSRMQSLKHFEFSFSGPLLKKKSDVGYRKPPVHTRFQKGQSGNPAGRPSAKKNRKKLVQKIASEPQKVMHDGKLVERSNIELALITLTNMAMEGNLAADKLRRDYLEKYDRNDGRPRMRMVVPEQVSVDEYMLLLDEFRRKSAEEFAKVRARDEDRFLNRPEKQQPGAQATL